MSSTFAPFGLRPIYNQSGSVRPRGYVNGVASAYGTALYQGTPVTLVTASSLNEIRIGTGGNGNSLLGVFAGVEYTDANGRRQYSKYWPASLAPNTAGQPSTWTVWVWDDPNTIFEVQCNGALSGAVAGGPGYIGQNIDLIAGSGSGGIGAGSSVTQLSAAAANASALSSATTAYQLRIVDKARYVDNDWNDTYPILQVQINQHQLRSAVTPV